MKLSFVILASLTFSHVAFGEWRSVVTDIDKDCVVISSSTSEAPIDFYNAECKSFGGFSLFITGMDLRYGPKLEFSGKEIDLTSPNQFHDLASNEIEWIYKYQVDKEGSGAIEWKGMIYKLSVATDDGQASIKSFYSISLNGNKSCFLGISKTKAEATALVHEPTCVNQIK